MVKVIKVDDDVHKQLSFIKIADNFTSFNEVIVWLLGEKNES